MVPVMTNDTEPKTRPEWTVEEIRAKLEESNRWLQRGLLDFIVGMIKVEVFP